MLPQLPRYQAVSRRSFVRRSLLLGGTLAIGGPLLAACGNDDDGALSGTGQDAGSEPGDTSSVATSPATAPASGDTTAAAAPATDTAVAADAIPASAQLQVSFTYTAADSGRRVRNPYIAVWVETPAGDLVQTISLWYQAREAEYLRELSGWYGAEADFLDAGGPDNVESVSGATRAAGSYDVLWDGTDAGGARVAAGEYVLFVESAREHGPHQLTTASLTLGADAFETALSDDGELTALTARYSV